MPTGSVNSCPTPGWKRIRKREASSLRSRRDPKGASGIFRAGPVSNARAWGVAGLHGVWRTQIGEPR
jgi:hypothetical protein